MFKCIQGLVVNDKNNDNKSLVTIRPLRDLSDKEISFYALYNKLDDFVHSNFLTAVSTGKLCVLIIVKCKHTLYSRLVRKILFKKPQNSL